MKIAGKFRILLQPCDRKENKKGAFYETYES